MREIVEARNYARTYVNRTREQNVSEVAVVVLGS